MSDSNAKLQANIRAAFATAAQSLWGDTDIGPWIADCHEAHEFANECMPFISAALAAVRAEERNRAEKLYDILDDISTAGDMAKSNDKLFRQLVNKHVERRSIYFTSDGYKLMPVDARARSEAKP